MTYEQALEAIRNKIGWMLPTDCPVLDSVISMNDDAIAESLAEKYINHPDYIKPQETA